MIDQRKSGQLGWTARRGLVGCIAAAMVVGLTACGGSSSDSSSSGSSSASGANTAALSVGMVSLDSTNISSQREVDAAKKAMEDQGWTVALQDPQGDPAKANAACTQFVTKQVDVIVIDVFQGSQMAQCLSSAKGANIPVFFIASTLSEGMAGAISTALPDPINELFIKGIKDKAKVQVLSLEYSPGSPCLIRAQAQTKALTDLGVSADQVQRHEVKIPGQVTDSQAATQAWLNAHPDGSGELIIWSCFSDAALGALAALNQAGRSVPIYTWDLTKQLVAPLKSGAVVATAISDANKLGEQLVGLVKAYKGGDTTPRGLDAPAIVLDKGTIDAYTAANTVS